MNREELVKMIEPLAQQAFGIDIVPLNSNQNSETVSSWTSLAYTQFLTEIENKMGVKFKMMDILKMQNMGTIIDVTLEKCG